MTLIVWTCPLTVARKGSILTHYFKDAMASEDSHEPQALAAASSNHCRSPGPPAGPSTIWGGGKLCRKNMQSQDIEKEVSACGQ
jgi:hypothetical protein